MLRKRQLRKLHCHTVSTSSDVLSAIDLMSPPNLGFHAKTIEETAFNRTGADEDLIVRSIGSLNLVVGVKHAIAGVQEQRNLPCFSFFHRQNLISYKRRLPQIFKITSEFYNLRKL